MKSKKKYFKKYTLLLLIPSFIMSVSGCSSSNKETILLRILNLEDYIYVHNEKGGFLEPTLYKETFRNYLNEYYPQFKDKNIEVIYDTTDTNETLYSKLQTGKSFYDLICVSEYLIQKLLSQDKLVPLDKSLIPNYFPLNGNISYASPYIANRLKSVTSVSYKTKEEHSIYDYSVGYMWGTFGILFNPTFDKFQKKDIDTFKDFTKWESFWDKKYEHSFSIKNSMRETYFVGAEVKYKEEISTLLNKYKSGQISLDTFQNEYSSIINRSDENSAKDIFNTLNPLKENAFGFEVDGGKQDIVTKKIGAFYAWSGESVYSIKQAHDNKQVSSVFDLYYSLPTNGSFIWLDGWVMPNNERSDDQYKLAHAFLNFLSDPYYAQKNMEYTGYSSMIGGKEIRDYVRSSYDERTAKLIYKDENNQKDYSIFYFDPTKENALTLANYSNFKKKEEQSAIYDNVPLSYYEGEYYRGDNGKYYDSETKNIISSDSPKLKPLNKKYNAEFEILPTWKSVDLSYIFEGTIKDGTEEDYIFYSENYYINEEESIGGDFFAQYAEEESLDLCVFLKDYRENNQTILKLWEDFKANSLPTWAVVVFVIEIVLFLLLGLYVISRKIQKKIIHKKRVLSEDNK